MGRRVPPRKVDEFGIEWKQDVHGYWYRYVVDSSSSYGFKHLREHREVWERHHGKLSTGQFIHHVNGDPGDNRIENLQAVTAREHRHIHRLTAKVVKCRECGTDVVACVEGRPRQYCEPCGERRARDNGGWRRFQVKQCEYCGKDFKTRLAPKGGRVGRFCSQRCVNRGARWKGVQPRG